MPDARGNSVFEGSMNEVANLIGRTRRTRGLCEGKQSKDVIKTCWIAPALTEVNARLADQAAHE